MSTVDDLITRLQRIQSREMGDIAGISPLRHLALQTALNIELFNHLNQDGGLPLNIDEILGVASKIQGYLAEYDYEDLGCPVETKD